MSGQAANGIYEKLSAARRSRLWKACLREKGEPLERPDTVQSGGAGAEDLCCAFPIKPMTSVVYAHQLESMSRNMIPWLLLVYPSRTRRMTKSSQSRPSLSFARLTLTNPRYLAMNSDHSTQPPARLLPGITRCTYSLASASPVSKLRFRPPAQRTASSRFSRPQDRS